jgi:ribosomal protein S18 acetylase RimI-like enzyme
MHTNAAGLGRSRPVDAATFCDRGFEASDGRLIRRLEADELPRLKPLWTALHRHHVSLSPDLGGIGARSAEGSWIYRRNLYSRWLEDPQTFVLAAEEAGQLLAYALVTSGPEFSSWRSDSGIAHLQSLSVDPAHRNQGLGASLLTAVRSDLAERHIAHLAISTLSRNVAAHRFYERAGFSPVDLMFIGSTQ